MDFNQYINNAISDIDNEISDLQQQRKEILSINKSTIFTDKEFQHICRTQLRSSNILAIFIPYILSILVSLIFNIDFDIDFELKDLLFVLIITSISFIFSYGYQIQKDSTGIMYKE